MTLAILSRSNGRGLLKICWRSAVVALVVMALSSPSGLVLAAEPVIPAEQGTGQPSEGFQLSLKFTKDHFAEDEPIEAVLITRNVSDRQRSFPYVTHYVEFLVVDEGGKRVPSREELDPRTSGLQKLVTSGKQIELVPGQEHETKTDLRKYFDVPRGRYTVSATRKVPAIDDRRVPSQVMSGNATFFSAGFKPQEKAAPTAQQGNRTNETIVSPKGNPAASTTNVASTKRQIATNGAVAERSQNVDVSTSFAQAQGGQSTKLYWVLGFAALIAVTLAVWFVRRKKSAV